MKKIVIGIAALLLLATIGVLVFSGDSEENTTISSSVENSQLNTSEMNQLEQNDTNNEENSETQTASGGLGYVDYSEETLALSQGSTRIVFFHAPWCSVCNFFEGQIEEQGVPNDVTILKVDFDTEDELKSQYGVNVQSTFVLLDDNGNVVESWPFARGLNGIQDLYNAVI